MKQRKIFYIIYIIVLFSFTFYFSLKIIKGEIKGYMPWTSKYMYISPKSEFFSPRLDKDYIEKLKNEIETYYDRSHNSSVEIYEGEEFEGIFVKLPKTIIKTNSDGFRDDEFFKEKPNDTFRIIALGDSYTLGLGVNVSDSWPDQLERKLNGLNNSIKFEVFNTGVCGYNLQLEVKLFKETGLAFNPDMVILQTEPGDYVNITKILKRAVNLVEKYQKGEIKIEGDLLELRNEILTIATKEYFEELNKKPFQERWKNVKILLQELMELTKNKNIDVILASFDDEPEFIKSYKIFCEKKGCHFLDLKDRVYSKYPSEILQLHPKDTHPTAFTYDKTSDCMLEKILEITEFN